MKFNWKYGIGFLVLLMIEIIIAMYVHDSFVRPFLGDVLVMGLIYCFLKTFVNWSVIKSAVAVLVFAFTIEFAQFFKLADVLGLSENKIASVILGSTFDWLDLVAYVLGFVGILLIEKIRN